MTFVKRVQPSVCVPVTVATEEKGSGVLDGLGGVVRICHPGQTGSGRPYPSDDAPADGAFPHFVDPHVLRLIVFRLAADRIRFEVMSELCAAVLHELLLAVFEGFFDLGKSPRDLMGKAAC